MTALDVKLVRRRIQEIRVFVQEMEKLADISQADFMKNRERQYAVMHLLLLAIEACISVGNHIVSRKRLGIPGDYQDIFALLEKGGILPADFAAEMKKMARFRNRLVHVYWDMDLEQIYDIITTKRSDFETYAAHIEQHT
jgi:uncharacterized protein YutE (UPF0331/DUF86 family)